MERLLSVSRELRDKVEQNEGAAGELLRQCEELREELKAMRQWREVVPSTEDNRVQMPNIEFKYIKQLQAENAELRVLLEEHQAAIEMIMTKYRQQVGQFMTAEKQELTLTSDNTADELLHRTDQLYHMAAVISLTMQEDDTSSQKAVQYITQLECENKHLRELLQFTQSGVLESATERAQHDNTPVNSPSTAQSSGLPFPKPPQPTPGGHPQAEFRTTAFHSGSVGISSGGPPGGSGGYVHVATPLNSGQTTPLVGGEEVGQQVLLEQARDKLTDSQT